MRRFHGAALIVVLLGMIAATGLPPKPIAPPAPASAPARPAVDPAREKAKIEALIEAIRSLEGAMFVRNGAEYGCDEAADHLRTKWTAAGDRIATAAQFIDEIGSTSSRSGRAYAIRLSDGNEITSRQFLLDELVRLEASADSPPVAPATAPVINPPAEGFNAAGSDAMAIELADRTMQAMGGRRAWDETRYLTWRFFGGRRHLWDKGAGDVRIEATARDGAAILVLMNINTRAGHVWNNGQEITAPDDLRAGLQSGLEWWINDSYWVFMPYKLKDSGVTLKHAGERAMEDGRAADVVTLTFEGVGVTPENKYEVFIAKESGLVEQWSYFETAGDAAPGFTMPWRNWRAHGRIMLSDDRGERDGKAMKHTDLAVLATVPAGAFDRTEPLDWPALLQAAEAAAPAR